MTTPSTEREPLPWWRYIGPWPLRPITMGIFITFLTLVTSASLFRVDSAFRLSVAIVLTGLLSTALLWVAEHYARSISRSFAGYLLVVLILSCTVTTIRSLSDSLVEFQRFGEWGNFAFSVIRSFVVALILLAILGINSRRLQRQIDRTQQALDIVKAQANSLLVADETVRQQVASVLHDRVQAGLIGACMQIQSTLPRVDDREAALLTKVIDSLEQLRGLDIRRAVRSLSPNLREVDMQSALEDLADTYSPGMTTSLNINIGIAPYEVRLGAYRIIEQALLNSALHGQATHCEISLDERDGVLELRVTDDGSGVSDQATSGLGSTLISTWCRTLQGTWSRESPSDGGTLVRARLPLLS